MGNRVPYYTSATLKCGQECWVFDSHIRNDIGLSCSEGKACLTFHKNKTDLCKFINELSASLALSDNSVFEMSSVVPSVSDNLSSLQVNSFEWETSESEFSGFEAMSEGEYTCRMYLAQELMQNTVSQESDMSDYDDLSDLSPSELQEGLKDLYNSSVFFSNFNENIFDNHDVDTSSVNITDEVSTRSFHP